MLRLYVVGCGGIGGYVTQLLGECCASLALDYLERFRVPITSYMEDAGNCVVPSIVNSITLIDGDEFDPHNAIRQGAGAGNKMLQRMLDLQEKMIRKTFLRYVKVDGFNSYINPENAQMIIPSNVSDEDRKSPNRELFDNLSEGINHDYMFMQDIPVIFICVDNVKTRYELCMYAQSFDSILLINGGNEKTTGQVNVYERRNGVALDPNIPELFANIRPDADKRPDELSCTHVAPKHDQTALTNCTVAVKMMEIFCHWVTKGTLSDFPSRKGQTVRYNEVVLDSFESL